MVARMEPAKEILFEMLGLEVRRRNRRTLAPVVFKGPASSDQKHNRCMLSRFEVTSVNVAVTAGYKETPVWIWLRESWVGDLVREFRHFRHELSAWVQGQEVALPEVEQLVASLPIFQSPGSEKSGGTNDVEEPIFLLSTGWRAGSTLLQRILLTDRRLLLWGEPLAEMAIVARLCEMLSDSISPECLEVWRNQQDPNLSALATSWIANLFPAGDDFRCALRSLFDRWLCVPARARGFSRWGFKEVRFGATEAVLLHWLYPGAKFVIISRHPYDAYRSFADAHWEVNYYRHPDLPANSAAAFAWHWNRLALSWSHLPTGFPAVHIKYEDLISGKVDFRSLESWLGLEINENVALSVKAGGTTKRSQLSWYERGIIVRETAKGMRVLGYSKQPD